MEKPEGLILSAGFSRRMHQLKPFVHYENTPFLLSIILKLAQICSKILVVTGYKSEEVRSGTLSWFDAPHRKEWLDIFLVSENLWYQIPGKIQFVFNPKFEYGMFGSLQAGLEKTVKKKWVIYHFVDQPHIPPSFYLEFIQQISKKFDWIQPEYQNKRGHPILLNQKVKDLVLSADNSETLKKISEKELIRKKNWNCSFRQVIENFNTKNDIKISGDNNENF